MTQPPGEEKTGFYGFTRIEVIRIIDTKNPSGTGFSVRVSSTPDKGFNGLHVRVRIHE
jgi:hypothetical protein